MAKTEVPILERLSLQSLRPLWDLRIDSSTNLAFLPADEIIRSFPGAGTVGHENQGVVHLMRGTQVLHNFAERIVGMDIVATNDEKYGPQHHVVFGHGLENIRQGEETTPIGLDHLCPGDYFNLDCGCRDHTDGVFQAIYGSHPDDALYISAGVMTSSADRLKLARTILDEVGLSNSHNIITTPGFDRDCNIVRALKTNWQVIKVFSGIDGETFALTHNIPVTFNNGLPAQLRVIEEAQMEDEHGFGGKAKKHFALVYGEVNGEKPPVMRYHSSCITAELGGNGCDCRQQREETLRSMVMNGSGILLYVEEEGMGSGLPAKALQTQLTLKQITDLFKARERFLGMPADMRTYSLLDVIRDVTGVKSVIFASNNKSKARKLEQHGIEIVGHITLPVDWKKATYRTRPDYEAKLANGNYVQYL